MMYILHVSLCCFTHFAHHLKISLIGKFEELPEIITRKELPQSVNYQEILVLYSSVIQYQNIRGRGGK